jgi:hypothetical protein
MSMQVIGGRAIRAPPIVGQLEKVRNVSEPEYESVWHRNPRALAVVYEARLSKTENTTARKEQSLSSCQNVPDPVRIWAIR